MWAAGLKQRTYLWVLAKQASEANEWISSSQAGSVVHMNKYQSKIKLWKILKGKEPRKNPSSDNPAIQHGNKWEQEGIEWAKLLIGREDIEWCNPLGTIIDLVGHTFCCSPDAIGYPRDGMFPIGIEVKCPYSQNIPETVEEINPSHLIQAFVCMMITQATQWYLFYYSPTEKEKSTLWSVSPSEKFWAHLHDAAKEMLQSETPPLTKTKDRVKADYSKKLLLEELKPTRIFKNKD
jgi:hypothetical protein